jgi:hypothetical protein
LLKLIEQNAIAPFTGPIPKRKPLVETKGTILGEEEAYDSPLWKDLCMADRQQFARTVEPDPELKRILEASRETPVTEEELHEQRISFAFGNAPRSSEESITKDSVRLASQNIKLLR